MITNELKQSRVLKNIFRYIKIRIPINILAQVMKRVIMNHRKLKEKGFVFPLRRFLRSIFYTQKIMSPGWQFVIFLLVIYFGKNNSLYIQLLLIY